MIDPQNPKRPLPGDPSDPREGDNTVELSLDEAAEVDLQALADEVAQSTPDKAPAPVPPRAHEPLDPVVFPEEAKDIGSLSAEELQAVLRERDQREKDELEKYRRLLADFANYRNRAGRDIQMAVDQSERRVLLELLPVLDSFERCIDSTYASLEDFHMGVELIRKQFLDALRRLGAEPIGLDVGAPFDAKHAEALTTTRNPDLPDGSVAAVFERGFTLRDQLLRAARVVVNHRPDVAPMDLDGPAQIQ